MKLKRRIHNLIGNNSGMSIVTVVVAIGFVAILISILMMSAVINFKMKNINMYSKDSFYSAEQVLDEINIGLQQMVSDGLSESYTYVTQNYDSENMSAEDKNALLQARYYQYIYDRLCYDTQHKTYICEDYSGSAETTVDGRERGLYGLLKESTQWHASANANEEYGAFIRSAANNTGASGEYLGNMTSYATKGIVLEGVQVYYKDPNGFVSEIQTDIRIAYPDFAFSNSNVPNISTYCFITDGGYEDKNNGTTTINGDTYAYKMDVKGSTLDFVKTELGTDLHLVATDCDIYKGGFKTNDTSTLWVRDIVAKRSDVNLAGYTYVADDLNLAGTNTDVTIKGYYYGYGNGNPEAEDLNDIDPESSSAILVNGSNSSLDMSKAKKISIAGHAFVAAQEADATDGKKDINVFTGESIAIKSNQLMYLVPGECIGVNKTTLKGLGSNPITQAQYELITSTKKDDYTEVDPTVTVGKLAGSIKDYIAYKGTTPDVERVVVRSATDPSQSLIYYYMKFKDENAANNYFARYYSLNKEAMDKYIDNYLKVLKIPSEGNTTLRLQLAGGVIEGNATDGYDNPGYVTENGMSEGKAANDQYSNEFESYCSKLNADYDNVASLTGITMYSPDNVYTSGENIGDPVAVLFDNLIDEDNLKEMAGEYTDADGKRKVQLIYRGDVNTMVAADETCSLIIANCGVTVSANFNGTIIAKGKVKAVRGGLTFKADPEAVGDCMVLETVPDADGISYSIANVFKDSDELKYQSIADGSDDDITMSDLVVMENWVKK